MHAQIDLTANDMGATDEMICVCIKRCQCSASHIIIQPAAQSATPERSTAASVIAVGPAH
jgi:hypothetical protein